jgi:hypothetical protein
LGAREGDAQCSGRLTAHLAGNSASRAGNSPRPDARSLRTSPRRSQGRQFVCSGAIRQPARGVRFSTGTGIGTSCGTVRRARDGGIG